MKPTAAVVAIAFAAVACSTDVDRPDLTSPHGTATVVATQVHVATQTLDDEFVGLAQRFPGFGGLFRDSTGALVALFTDLRAIDPAAEPALLQFARDGQHDLMGPPTNGDGRITFRLARYDFAQLSEVARIARANKGERAFSVDVNEAENRVVVVAEQDRDSLATVLRLRDGGLSDTDVRVEVRRRPSLSSTTDIRAKTAAVAGIEIGLVGAGGRAATCTTGFTFRLRDIKTRAVSREYYLATASHCSKTWGKVDGGAILQPTVGRQIGVEVFEAPTLPGQSCPSGRPCQAADLSVYEIKDPLVRQSLDIQRGLLAWPDVGGSAFDSYQNWTDLETAGGSYGTVGATSGRVQGDDLRSTCATLYYDAPFNRAFTCQNEVRFRTYGGDSGAPVYSLAASGRPILRGIVSGHSDWSWWNLKGWHFEHTTWYSPLFSIRMVLQNRWPGKEILFGPYNDLGMRSCGPGVPGVIEVFCSSTSSGSN
ncbi:MAG TPA: hypothetical protein VIP11_17220 [Gemmatimonadaceae bacterium]